MSARARQFYDQVAPWLMLLIGVVAAVGIWVGASATITNARQDAQTRAESEVRDQQQKALLDCFDDFASQLAGGLPPVREASASRDDALASALDALREGLVKAQQGGVGPSDLTAIIDSFANYQRAADDLTRAREENPYPEAPSAFCSTR